MLILPKKKNDLRKYLLVFGVAVIIGLVVYFGANSLSIINTDTTSTTTSGTTIQLISYVDGEDVSWMEVSIWTPDPDKTIDEYEDLFVITNFEETEASKDAEDISIDLSSYTYYWIEIDPDGESYFETTWILKSGGINSLQTIYVYHQASDVDINVLDVDGMDEWDLTSDATIKVILDVPHASSNQLHYGDDWSISTEDYNDMTTEEVAEMQNQQKWRCEAPKYSPIDDDEKEYDDDLERLTDAFAIEFDFNNTVSLTDGATTQVNLSLHEDSFPGSSYLPIEIVVSGDKIYAIFFEVIDFEDGAYDFDVDIELGSEIGASTVKTGRLEVPRGNNGLGTFTALSTASL